MKLDTLNNTQRRILISALDTWCDNDVNWGEAEELDAIALLAEMREYKSAWQRELTPIEATALKDALESVPEDCLEGSEADHVYRALFPPDAPVTMKVRVVYTVSAPSQAAMDKVLETSALFDMNAMPFGCDVEATSIDY